MPLAGCLTEHANGSTQRTFDAEEPLRTQVAQVKGGHFALISANLVTLRNGCVGSSADGPVGCITRSGGHHAIASAHLEQANGKGDGRSADDPFSTILAKGSNQRLVTAYMVKYYGAEKNGI